MKDIKFGSYDGKYPNLCRGRLVIYVDGKRCFADNALSSGGSVYHTGDYDWHIESGLWDVDFSEFKIDGKHLETNFFSDSEKKYIIYMINENVELGCCGGYT